MSEHVFESLLSTRAEKWLKELEAKEKNSIFDEEPVPLDVFLYEKSWLNLPQLSEKQHDFVKHGVHIYKDTEVTNLKWDDIRRVGELVAWWGKGSGKNFISEIIFSRIAYLLLCLTNPQRYLNQADISGIDMLNMAYNSDQAETVFFKTFSDMVKSCSWFNNKCEIKSNMIQFDKKIAAYSGNAYEESFEGKNLIVAVLDEISAFKTKMEVQQLSMRRMRAPRYSAESVFDMAKSSIESRFGLGTGKLISLSFSRFKNDYIQQLYEAGKNEKTCYASFGATWEVNPNKKKSDFDDEFRKNPERANARYACNPSGVEGGYFKNKSALATAFPILPAEHVPTTDDRFPILKDWFKCTHSALCSVHIDLGLRRDKAGFCISHVSEMVKESKKDEQGVTTEIELPVVTIDLLTSFIAPMDGEIDFSLIRQLLVDCINRGFRIGLVSLDGWQSVDFTQIVSKMGIETVIRSVDRNTDAYDCLKELVYMNRLKGYSYLRAVESAIGMQYVNEIIEELSNLLLVGGKKVDHPAYGCFTGNTRVSLVDGREVSFLQLIEEQSQSKVHFVYAIDVMNNKIIAAKIGRVFKTKTVSQLVEVTLDSGEIIECTPEHLFMNRDSNYVEAKVLKSGDSLMPLYRKVSDKGLAGYRMMYNPLQSKWQYEHIQFLSNQCKRKNSLAIVNHKVASIRIIERICDVYDLEVPLYHNFALSAGVFVHNSKDTSDSVAGSVQGAIELGLSSFTVSDIIEGGHRETYDGMNYEDREYLGPKDDGEVRVL